MNSTLSPRPAPIPTSLRDTQITHLNYQILRYRSGINCEQTWLQPYLDSALERRAELEDQR